MPDDPYSLADLARLAGVTPRTVRYYVAQGLLPSPEQAGPATRYAASHLARLRLIRRLQRDHLPLAEIRSRLEGLDDQQILDALGTEDVVEPAGDALGFVHALMAEAGVTPSMGPPPPATPPPAMSASMPEAPMSGAPMPAAMPVPDRLAASPPPLFRRVERVELPPPGPRSTPPDRSTWERLVITPDVELHVRRPLDRHTNRRVDQLERIARELLQLRPLTPKELDMQDPNDPTRRHRLVDPRLDVRPDRHLIRANGRSERYLLVEVVAPTVVTDTARRRPPVNLAFVLDRSGSMGANGKLPLAKQATLEAIDRLDAADRFAVVTYDAEVEVVAPGSDASPDARRRASRELATVEPRGSTNLHAGWLTGCEQVAAGLAEQGVNRVLLLTDGLANVGITDREELGRLAFDLRRRGVTTSTFGVGVDFDEALLQAMADNGGGHFYYASDVGQMRDHITSEVGETLEVVAREVVLELVLPESVRVDSLSPFRVEQAGGRARILLGDMVSGQVLTIALRVAFDYGDVGREVGVLVRVTDRDRAFDDATPALAPVSLAWTYADHAANDAQARDLAVDRVVARLFAERARQEAVRLNREGRFDDARHAIDGVRKRVAAYAAQDPELNGIVAALHDEERVYAAPMPETARKSRHYAASLACRMRTPDGKSTRG